jgi:hypothetical protein
MKEFHVFFGCNALADFMPEICGATSPLRALMQLHYWQIPLRVK